MSARTHGAFRIVAPPREFNVTQNDQNKVGVGLRIVSNDTRRNGEAQDLFLNAVMFIKTDDKRRRFLAQGIEILVEDGWLQPRSYQDSSGQTRNEVELFISNWRPISWPSDEELNQKLQKQAEKIQGQGGQPNHYQQPQTTYNPSSQFGQPQTAQPLPQQPQTYVQPPAPAGVPVGAVPQAPNAAPVPPIPPPPPAG